MRTEDVLSVACRAGLMVRDVYTREEAGETQWGFRLLDKPYTPVWATEAACALRYLVEGVLLDDYERLSKYSEKSERFNKRLSLLDGLLDELEAME